MLFFTATGSRAQNKIGDNRASIQPGALLELESVNKGFLNVRMSTVQMLAIPVGPGAKGMSVFNLDSNCICMYNGSSWRSLCTDTAYLNFRLRQKLNLSDTASMLAGYVRFVSIQDSLSAVRLALNAKVNYTDTASMLIGYVRKNKYSTDSTVWTTGMVSSVKYADTTAMLSPYATKVKTLADSNVLATQTQLRVKYTDTAAMLSPYATKVKVLADSNALAAQIQLRVKYTDTAVMLSPYATKVKVLADSNVLAAQTQLRVKYTDTATMLAPYMLRAKAVADSAQFATDISNRVKYTDTSSMLAPYLRTAYAVKYADTAAMLQPYATRTKVLSDSLVLATDISSRVLYTDTAAMLAPYARSGAAVKYADTSAMLSPYLRNAVNGLSVSAQTVSLGGALQSATTVTASATNTFAIAGLQDATVADSVLMAGSGGVLKKINTSAILKEPWQVVGGTNKADSNTQTIYQSGNVSVGKNTNTTTLDIGGTINADTAVKSPVFVTGMLNLASGPSVTWNMSAGTSAILTLTGNCTISIVNAQPGTYATVKLVQDATGGRVVTTWPANTKWPSGVAPTLSTAANAADIVSFFFDGVNYNAIITKDFR